jgi:hypothetical protein
MKVFYVVINDHALTVDSVLETYDNAAEAFTRAAYFARGLRHVRVEQRKPFTSSVTLITWSDGRPTWPEAWSTK